ncbi:hypothetical protein [Streptomyces sp. TS71-3]|uniref:hypothetical protein n=1 Tax=Streptomyces sp. TS71-3 TaxID=2733862 RepID=UPI001B15C162|nr:hypothetical protein [Streptomyces sp. TS71-3]GHJ41310.1 hypothetical protein Sm713_69190 [Streptomyces sp. TS71-3]
MGDTAASRDAGAEASETTVGSGSGDALLLVFLPMLTVQVLAQNLCLDAGQLAFALVMVLLCTGRRWAAGRAPGAVGRTAALTAVGLLTPGTPLGSLSGLTPLPLVYYVAHEREGSTWPNHTRGGGGSPCWCSHWPSM